MRFAFEKNINNYKELAKDHIKVIEDNDATISLEKLGAAIEWHVTQAAKKRETSVKDQKSIYELQKTKQYIMRQLKDDLAGLDNPDYHIELEPSARNVTYTDGRMILENDKPITVGELITDSEWGIYYHLDDSIPREVRKKYLVESAKAKLQKLLDQQISIDEIGSTKTNDNVRKAYIGKSSIKEGDPLPPGLIAEAMVKNFFQKLTTDYDLSFKIFTADVHEDITKKIDFIIHRKSYNRGVSVDTHDKGEIAVQFVSTDNAETIKHKQEQIARTRDFMKQNKHATVDDFVLVSIPLDTTKRLYKTWSEQKSSGGPDKLWDAQTKELVFRKTLAGILDPHEIDEQWAMVQKGNH